MTPFVEALVRHARATPERLALRCGVGEEALTTDYAALWRRIERVGGHLRETWRIAPGDRVLACVNGYFSTGFARVATAYGIEVERLDVPYGSAIRYPSAVVMTSTGVS